MSRWFAAQAELTLQGGYFYLCPACYAERIEPEFDAIAERIRAYQKPDRAAAHEPATNHVANYAGNHAATAAGHERDLAAPEPATDQTTPAAAHEPATHVAAPEAAGHDAAGPGAPTRELPAPAAPAVPAAPAAPTSPAPPGPPLT